MTKSSTYPQSGLQNNELEVLSITPVEGRGSLRAFVNLRLGDLILNDCRVIQEPGKHAWFSLPVLSYKTQYGTTQYRTFIQIVDENLKNRISEAVLSAWENKRGESNGKSPK